MEDKSSKSVIVVCAVVAAAGLILANFSAIYGLLSSIYVVGNTGIINSANINVYKESQCTNLLSTISWGGLDPGTSKNAAIFVKNEGNVNLTLTLSTESWNPTTAETYINLTWNYTGQKIQPSEVAWITLTLAVAQNISGITNYSFNIRIMGTQA